MNAREIDRRLATILAELYPDAATARETVQIVADALSVPDGWTLGGDAAGLYFAPPPAPQGEPEGEGA